MTIATRNEHDYISLSDMVRSFEGQGALIEQWLKAKDTVLFLGVWEQLNNPQFNSLEFEGIKNEAGRNSFFLSVKKWAEKTGAIGVYASAGRYGGTYAHRDIAFEFGSWLSPELKLPAAERLLQLNAIAIVQMRSLLTSMTVERLTEGKQSSRALLAGRAATKKGGRDVEVRLPVIALPGLSPDSLGNYLASLGLLRMLSRKWPSTRIAWRDEVLQVVGGPPTLDELLEELVRVATQRAWDPYERAWPAEQTKGTKLGQNKKTASRAGTPIGAWRAEQPEDAVAVLDHGWAASLPNWTQHGIDRGREGRWMTTAKLGFGV